ncbi:beta-ketoacyl synthase-like protein [Chitinophaga skermanii]|uniref:Beta-ketoacyl synthase-like protein n=1 Tax=Chitinophaga skermanii TaxID=331697 RepID=A0A327R2I9_9BACT|nr:beta-ketoacyl synthase chain length factor [Chitinophaga skermanii]RAJ11036.1 beta-ketoacyl synthase-like protein [Chitinophaga skermanii]
MLNKCYIQATSAISPQHTFEGEFHTQPFVASTRNLLNVIEPNYSGFISPNNLRRMSRLLKIGQTAALKCLVGSEFPVPGAIITGTGKGSLHDTEKFLKNIREYEETALNPTPFIQSTYNAVNGLIALQQKCTSYNNTFVHRGFSFESALQDTLMQLQEGVESVLVGSFEEMSEEHFYIKGRIGHWKEGATNETFLADNQTTGSIAGEGSAYFLVTAKPASRNLAVIEGVEMVYKPTTEQLGNRLQKFLAQHGNPTIDVLLTGENGDANFAHYYQYLHQQFSPSTTIIPFKQLCGEYDTASSFATWLATEILVHQSLPLSLQAYNTASLQNVQHVLIYNNFMGEQHSFILLSK